MTVSVLVPSRERPELLARSIESLRGGDLEVLVALDDDDPRLADYAGIGTAVIGPHYGYSSLQRYYNGLANRASGDWLLLWNDDCIMETENWIEIVRSHDGEMVVMNPRSNHNNWDIDMNVFPVFPRKIVELMGHVSFSRHTSSWLEYVARDAGIMIRVPISIHHDRADLTGNNDDAVYRARELDHKGFHSDDLESARERDVETIRAYLERNDHARPR
jgi:glycosyltransferase involved in cell wall biosynthesis